MSKFMKPKDEQSIENSGPSPAELTDVTVEDHKISGVRNAVQKIAIGASVVAGGLTIGAMTGGLAMPLWASFASWATMTVAGIGSAVSIANDRYAINKINSSPNPDDVVNKENVINNLLEDIKNRYDGNQDIKMEDLGRLVELEDRHIDKLPDLIQAKVFETQRNITLMALDEYGIKPPKDFKEFHELLDSTDSIEPEILKKRFKEQRDIATRIKKEADEERKMTTGTGMVGEGLKLVGAAVAIGTFAAGGVGGFGMLMMQAMGLGAVVGFAASFASPVVALYQGIKGVPDISKKGPEVGPPAIRSDSRVEDANDLANKTFKQKPQPYRLS